MPPEKALHGLLFYLAFASMAIAGTYARMGLFMLTRFERFGVVWANVTGCIIMGLQQSVFHNEISVIAGTGFCGSLTSFSSLILDFYQVSTTPQSNWATYGYGVMVFMAYFIIEVACPCVAYQFGRHIGRLCVYVNLVLPDRYQNALLWMLALAGVCGWAAVLVLAIVLHDRFWPLMGVFAPLGLYLRFWLSKLNTAELKFGTFIANMLATSIACTLFILSSPRVAKTDSQLSILNALINGFAGTLSTVSTFVAELHTLHLPRAYIYGILTLGTGWILAVITMGSYFWTHHPLPLVLTI